MAFSDHIESLIDKSARILASEKNVIRDECTRFNTIYIGNIQPDLVTFELQPTLPALARKLGYDLNRFFQDRDFNYEKTLEYRLWHRENIPDDSPFIGIYEMDFACHSQEYAMLGVMPRWTEGETPSYGLPIVETREDLKKLVVPDFFKAGFMPKLIEDYHRIKENLKGRLEVCIRKSVQGPFQTSTGLHGQENVFMDMLTDIDFVQELLEFAFLFHKEYVRGWEKLHARGYGRFNIGDDDIDTRSTMSPPTFRNMMMPMYRRYAERFKVIHWHSCGNTDDVFQDIASIPGLEILEIGPYDDTVAAARIFKGSGVRFYKCPNVPLVVNTTDKDAQIKFCEEMLQAGELVPLKILCEADDMDYGLNLLKVFREVSGKK